MNVEDITMNITRLALDAGQMRQAAIAANIANINNPGYVPVQVSFEEQLYSARQSLHLGGHIREGSLDNVRPYFEKIPMTGSERDIKLDTEVVKLMTNAVQFQTLLRGVSRHLALLQLAVTEGRK